MRDDNAAKRDESRLSAGREPKITAPPYLADRLQVCKPFTFLPHWNDIIK